MPAILCSCGERVSYGEIPSPNEWLAISDVDYEKFQGEVDAELIYKKMTHIIKCSNCSRLYIFYNGFENDPISYSREC